jgi:hypothetical protein
MTQTLKAILESGGLTEHFEKFDGRGITDSILDEITDSDLRDFGISKLGERKRLLSAFRRSDEFQGAAIASHEDEEDIPAAEVPEPEPPDDVQEIDEAPEETPAPARTTKPRASQSKSPKKISRPAAETVEPALPVEAPKRPKPARHKKSPPPPPPPLEEEPAPEEPAQMQEAQPTSKSMASALIWVMIFGPFGLLYVSFARAVVFTLIFLVGAVFAYGNLLGLLAVWMLAPMASILLFGLGRR